MKPDIAEFIKNRIDDLPKMSFRKLEILSGVSRSEISYIINKKRKKPNPEILKAIVSYLKSQYEYLLYLTGYISEACWAMIEQESIKRRQKSDLAEEKISEKEEVYYSLGLLSAEEKDMLFNFRKIKGKKTKSFLKLLYEISVEDRVIFF